MEPHGQLPPLTREAAALLTARDGAGVSIREVVAELLGEGAEGAGARALLVRRIDIAQAQQQFAACPETDAGAAELGVVAQRRAAELCLAAADERVVLLVVLERDDPAAGWLRAQGISAEIVVQQLLNDHDPVVAALLRARDELHARKWDRLQRGDYDGSVQWAELAQAIGLVLTRACAQLGLPQPAVDEAAD